MARRRKARVEQDEAVRLFAARLREVRRSRGMTQAELSRRLAGGSPDTPNLFKASVPDFPNVYIL